ncbi:cell adhesion molecule CEACAM18 [Tamandua tetradactyla]|uniref:cell adhesion molecule CEACAM18 n=1 Tax=Tamandua tetradactyla TaxID=48850 RepID=UPI0040540A6A
MDRPSPRRSPWRGLLLAASLLVCGTSLAYSQIFISPDSLLGLEGFPSSLVLKNAPAEALEYSWHRGADGTAGNMIASYRPPSKSWQVGPEHRGRENVSHTGDLLIQDTELNDTGNYTVRVEASNGTQTATGWLEIQEWKNPSISVNTSSGVEFMDSIEAVCHTNVTKVTWLLNSGPVSSSDRLTISPDGKSLLLRRLNRYDWTLQCQIEIFEEILLKSALIFLNVNYGPDNVQLWSQPSILQGVLSAPVGAQVKLKCISSQSVPQPSYRWTHNGSFLSTVAELTFPSLAWEQMGSYRCIVENPRTQLSMYADASVRVPVLRPPVAILPERSGFYIMGPTVVLLSVTTALGGVSLCGILIYSLISSYSRRTNRI